MLTLMSLNLLVRLTLSPVCWRTVSGLGQDLFSSFLMWTRGAVILLVMSVNVTTLTRSLWLMYQEYLIWRWILKYLCFSLLINMSRKLMNANSMRAEKTDMKQMMMNTSRAVAYPTWGLALPPNPIVTTAKTVVAPSWVLAGVSWPLSVLTSQNVTQELITMMYRGTYTWSSCYRCRHFPQQTYLEDVETNCSSEVKLEVNDRPDSILHLDELVAVVPSDHLVLGQLQGVVHAQGGRGPGVLQLVHVEPEAANLQWTGLGVQRELPEIHLAPSRHCQALRVGDLSCRGNPNIQQR